MRSDGAEFGLLDVSSIFGEVLLLARLGAKTINCDKKKNVGLLSQLVNVHPERTGFRALVPSQLSSSFTINPTDSVGEEKRDISGSSSPKLFIDDYESKRHKGLGESVICNDARSGKQHKGIHLDGSILFDATWIGKKKRQVICNDAHVEGMGKKKRLYFRARVPQLLPRERHSSFVRA